MNELLLQELLAVFNFKQHVHDPTHKNGHTLDLVITRADQEPVENVRVSDPVISDYRALHFDTSLLVTPSFERRKVTYRKLHSVDKRLFTRDIKNSAVMNHEFTGVSALVHCYNKTLLSVSTKLTRSSQITHCNYQACSTLVLTRY